MTLGVERAYLYEALGTASLLGPVLGWRALPALQLASGVAESSPYVDGRFPHRCCHFSIAEEVDVIAFIMVSVLLSLMGHLLGSMYFTSSQMCSKMCCSFRIWST